MIKKLINKLGWLDLKKTILNYNLKTFKADFWAGILVAVVGFPSVMAFAALAGLNPIYGLHSFIIVTLVGAFFGASTFMVMGPTNMIALMIASAIGSFTISGLTIIEAVALLTLMTGLIEIILSLIDFGRLTNYISRPVIVGLITGVAFTITGKQLPKILGLNVEAKNIFISLYQIILNFKNIDFSTFYIGFATLFMIIAVRKIKPKAPDYLMGVVFAIFLVFFLNIESEIELIGNFQNSLPTFKIPVVDFNLALKLFSYSFAIAMLGFINVVTITEINKKGAINKDQINKDYFSLGIVNMFCAFFNGFAGGASFSRSFVNFKAGAKTRFSKIIAGLAVLFFLLFFSSIIAFLPLASLSAILILIAFQMVNLKEIKRILKTTKFDFLIFLSTFAATIFIPRLDYAVYVGIIFSLLLILKESSGLNHSYLKIEDREINQRELEELEGEKQIIIDLSGILHFNTVSNLEKELKEVFCKEKIFILRMRNVESVDITTISELENFVDKVRDNGGDVFFSGLSDQIRDDFKKYGLTKKLGVKNYFPKEKVLFSASKKAIKQAENNNS
jgi:SulP family sulfate permease